MSKIEQSRRDGVRIAYHIIKDANDLNEAKALLESRLTRTEATECPVFVRDADLSDFESKVKNNVFTMILSCVFALLEKPEYGLNKEQMNKVGEDLGELVDTIYGGWLDFPDLVQYFKDEYDIDLEHYIVFSQERLDRIEEKLLQRNEFVGGKYKILKKSE